MSKNGHTVITDFMSRHSPRMDSKFLKISLILIYLALGHQALSARFSSLSGSAVFIVFAVLYLLLAAGLVAAAFARRWGVRVPVALAFAAASIVQHAFEWTTAGPHSYQAFINLSNATGQIDAAMAQHGYVLTKAALAGLVLFAAVALPPGRHAIANRWAMAVPAIALITLTVMLYLRGGEGSRGLPAAYPPLSYSLFMAASEATKDRSPREAANLPRAAQPQIEDIVLLVDESIAGNYLDINNPHGVRSGLNTARKNIDIINFGYAAAINKCSANSNAVLRFGGTQANFQKAIDQWPSIWSYARAAAMRTVYIDGQSTAGRLQNLMTPAERREIDDFIQFDTVPVRMRDMAIADKLAAHLNNGRREFIYVNKVGAHFPIADKYPAEFEIYRPALPRTEGNSLLSWTSDRSGFRGTDDEWIHYRNSYRNTLIWIVGYFFDKLFREAQIGKSVVIYTSDHGQDLHERRNPGNNTHCGSQDAAQEEGLVPLVIIQGSGLGHSSGMPDWRGHLGSNRNASSAFRIFPTLLVLMGYERAPVRLRYGFALDEIGNDQFAYSLDFSEPLLGRAASFRTIDVSRIVSPPRSDFAAAPQ